MLLRLWLYEDTKSNYYGSRYTLSTYRLDFGFFALRGWILVFDQKRSPKPHRLSRGFLREDMSSAKKSAP
jgi:hypothetical protein